MYTVNGLMFAGGQFYFAVSFSVVAGIGAGEGFS